MTVNGFINNLEGTNDGDNFPKETLKALYQSIKSKPLEWATDEDDEQKEERPQQKPGNGTMTLHSNPFVEVRCFLGGFHFRDSSCMSQQKLARQMVCPGQFIGGQPSYKFCFEGGYYI